MDTATLDDLCGVAASLYARGYAFGSTGNLSVRAGDRVWITPTGQSLRSLAGDGLACMDLDGVTIGENKPSKESPFHLAIYKTRADARAVVHLHSTYSVALSCLEEVGDEQSLPPVTPYFFMRVAPLAVLPYFPPGSAGLAVAVEEASRDHNCMLLRNHGLICMGSDLNQAVDRAEELEETARLYFILRGERVRHLTPDQIRELRRPAGA